MTTEITSVKRYNRDELLALQNDPKCAELPPGLQTDDLSDLMESVFFDKATSPIAGGSAPGGTLYLGPQGGLRPGAGFTGAARRHSIGTAPRTPIHSRLVEDGGLSPDDRFRRNDSGLISAFAASPGKALPGQVPPRPGRFDDPARMDRWDSHKAGTSLEETSSDWSTQGRADRSDWRTMNGGGRGGGGGPNSADAARAGSGWGPRDSGALVDKDGKPGVGPGGRGLGGVDREGSGVFGRRSQKDSDDDWRARKQAGAAPPPRFDWSDRKGPPPGFEAGGKGGGMPEWASDDAPPRGVMTAEDVEAERQRMQEEWRRQKAGTDGQSGGGGAKGSGHAYEVELMDDSEIESWMKEEQEKQRMEDEEDSRLESSGGRPGHQAPAGKVDVNALFGGQGPSQQQQRIEEDKMASRFVNFFSLEENKPAAAALNAQPQNQGGARIAQAAMAAALNNDGSAGGGGPRRQVGFNAPPPGAGQQQQQGQEAGAGSTLLAMLQHKPGGGAMPPQSPQQQLGGPPSPLGGPPPPHMMRGGPPPPGMGGPMGPPPPNMGPPPPGYQGGPLPPPGYQPGMGGPLPPMGGPGGLGPPPPGHFQPPPQQQGGPPPQQGGDQTLLAALLAGQRPPQQQQQQPPPGYRPGGPIPPQGLNPQQQHAAMLAAGMRPPPLPQQQQQQGGGHPVDLNALFNSNRGGGPPPPGGLGPQQQQQQQQQGMFGGPRPPPNMLAPGMANPNMPLPPAAYSQQGLTPAQMQQLQQLHQLQAARGMQQQQPQQQQQQQLQAAQLQAAQQQAQQNAQLMAMLGIRPQ